MNIGTISIVEEGENVKVSASINWTQKTPDVPTHLWFSYPSQYAQTGDSNSNGFLTSLVPVAMFFGEDIHVAGTVSSHLLYNLREYQKILCFWKPEWFSEVSITADHIDSSLAHVRGGGVMCSFSGGVDSTYTLWRHLAQNESIKSHRVTHTLYVEAFDTPSVDVRTQKIKKDAYGKLMNRLGLSFVPVATNAKDFHNFHLDLAMSMTYSAILLGTAQLFEKDISKFYFAADNTHDYGLHSIINHQLVPLLSTEDLNATVFGASISKMEKLKDIAEWPETYSHLVVCWENPDGLKNCGKCLKCCHISTALDMFGAFQKYKTFPPKVDRHSVRTRNHLPAFYHFPKTWRRFAWEHKRFDYVLDFTYVLWRCTVRHTYLNFLKYMYRLSAGLKMKSPRYEQLVRRVKSINSKKEAV